jgi:hypothetical protein
VPAELFGESAGQRRHSQTMPMRGDAGAVRGMSEEVRGQLLKHSRQDSSAGGSNWASQRTHVVDICPVGDNETNIDKQPGHSLGLKDVPLLKCRGCDEITAISGISASRGGHKAPQRLKAAMLQNLIAGLEALRHPKAE